MAKPRVSTRNIQITDVTPSATHKVTIKVDKVTGKTKVSKTKTIKTRITKGDVKLDANYVRAVQTDITRAK